VEGQQSRASFPATFRAAEWLGTRVARADLLDNFAAVCGANLQRVSSVSLYNCNCSDVRRSVVLQRKASVGFEHTERTRILFKF